MSEIPEIRQRTDVAQNKFFTFAEERLGLANGGDYTYYHLESHFDAVVVVPVLPDGNLVIERIYRHPYRRYFHEFPAGGIEPGEDPCAAGARELAEETGFRAETVEPLVSMEAMPGLLRMRLHFVLAQGLHADAELERDAMEILEVQHLSESAAWDLARDEAASSFLTMGLLALAKHRHSESEAP